MIHSLVQNILNYMKLYIKNNNRLTWECPMTCPPTNTINYIFFKLSLIFLEQIIVHSGLRRRFLLSVEHSSFGTQSVCPKPLLTGTTIVLTPGHDLGSHRDYKSPVERSYSK